MKRVICTFGLAFALSSPLAATGGQSHDAHDHAAPGGRPPEQLGKVSFPTSCDAKVQAQFERGVALLHSFWFGEGLKAFTAVAEQDPGCAMAHWGIAINRLLNPFGGEPGPAFLKEGAAAIEKAKAIGARRRESAITSTPLRCSTPTPAPGAGRSARSPTNRRWRVSSSAIPRT